MRVKESNTSKLKETLKKYEKLIYALMLNSFSKIDIYDYKTYRKAAKSFNKELKKLVKTFDYSIIKSTLVDNITKNLKSVDKYAKVKSTSASVTKIYNKDVDKLSEEVIKTLDKTFKGNSKQYQKILEELNKAVNKDKTMTTAQASKKFKDIVKKNGTNKIVTDSGRKYDPSYYAEMVTRTEGNKRMINTTLSYMEDNEWGSIVKVSKHSHREPRDGCKAADDNYINLDGEGGEMKLLNGDTISFISSSEANYGEPAGIFGINCTHGCRPAIPYEKQP